ncbi:MAG TPA: DUF1428 domain-containing protein [Candidatus Paceibacterota bacterium]|jgi:uncharacterized protein YbaA (DUF1428 family)
MAKYVDGFVIPIPKKNLEDYKKMAKVGGKVWREHGALDYKECIGEDLEPDMGHTGGTSFSKMSKMKDGETIVFAYIVYKSRKHRDQVNAKVMKDPRMNDPKWHTMMPFSPKRMAYGGFEVIVDA